MKRYIVLIILSSLVLFNGTLTDALLVATVTATNSDGALTNARFPVKLSTQSLIDSSTLAPDTLNVDMHDLGDNEVGFMPSPVNTDLSFCKQDDGGVFTDFSTECTDTATNDIDLLPSTPVVDDAFYFGSPFPFAKLNLTVGTAGSSSVDWELTWEYCTTQTGGDPSNTCAVWENLSGIEDLTDAFRESGENIATWDIPYEMKESTEDSDQAFWVRARVSNAGTGPYIQPLGTFADWDMSIFFVSAGALGENETHTSMLYVGGSSMDTSHDYVPGPAGITTADAAALEPGTDFGIDVQVNVNTEYNDEINNYILRKKDAFLLSVSDDEEISAYIWNGGGSSTTSYIVDSAGDSVDAITKSGCTLAYQCIDEDPNDGVTTHLSNGSGVFLEGYFNVEPIDLDLSNRIISVQACVYASMDSGTGQVNLGTSLDGTDSSLDLNSVSGASYTEYCVSPAETSDPLGNPWTRGSLNRTQLHFTFRVSSGTVIRITQGSLKVTYEPADAAVTATGVTSGDHRIQVDSDGGVGAEFELLIDTVVEDTDAIVSPINNSNDWEWLLPGINYGRYIKYTVGGSQLVWYEIDGPVVAGLAENRGSGGSTYDGELSYPELSIDLQGNLGPFATTSVTSVSSSSLGTPDLTGSVNTDDLTPDITGGASIPFFGPFFNGLASSADLPVQIFWVAGATVILLAIIVHVAHMTTNLLITSFIAGIIITTFMVIGIIPPWYLFYFGPIAVVIILFTRRSSIGL